MNDVNYSAAGSSSLRLYVDDKTQYIAHESPCTLESLLNQDIERLTLWFTANYLQVNATNIERTNHYAIKTLLNLGNSATYDFCLAMADMEELWQRRTLQSLILFFKCFILDGPNYISQFFTPRLTKYNLRDSDLNVVQPQYNSLIIHNSYLYMIAHIWNQLPTVTKSSSTLAQFRARLNNVNFTGCQCMNCM